MKEFICDYVQIREIGRVVTGKTPVTSHREYYNGSYMFISPTELHSGYCVNNSEKTITEKGLESIKSNMIQGTSVLVGCIGWDMGNVAMCFEKCATNQQINSITEIKEKYNPFYVYYWLCGKKEYLFSIASVTRTPILSKSVFEEVLIPFPKKDKQDKIARILRLLDEKISINKQINDNLEQMAMSIYDHWFTQFDFPDSQGKPYKSSGNEMIWNESIKKMIPSTWKVLKLEQVIKNICTGLNPRNNFSLGNGNIRYVTVKNLTTSGTLDFSGCDMINETAHSIVHNRSDISIGDILFASIAPLGRCFLIQDEPHDWDINESVFSIRANAKYVTPQYLYMYFMSDNFIKGATSSSTGSIFKGIRIGTLQDTLAVIPTLDIISAYSEKAKKLLALKSKVTNESAQLIKLRDWLLPMLMNGQATIED